MLDQRGQLLREAVGFVALPMPSYDRALHALRTWLDSWSGIGHVTVGMARQGYDLNSRATTSGAGARRIEHSPARATGKGWERTPWHAEENGRAITLSRLAPVLAAYLIFVWYLGRDIPLE
jgi:hypothetical protein